MIQPTTFIYFLGGGNQGKRVFFCLTSNKFFYLSFGQVEIILICQPLSGQGKYSFLWNSCSPMIFIMHIIVIFISEKSEDSQTSASDNSKVKNCRQSWSMYPTQGNYYPTTETEAGKTTRCRGRLFINFWNQR